MASPEARTDATGVVHEPAGGDFRIVSLVPSITELLFDLGLGKQVVGRTTFCIRPQPAVGAVQRVGGTKTIAFDRLKATAPTHVIVNIDENLRDDVPRLEAAGAKVIVTHPMGPKDNAPLFALLGAVFGAEDRAAELCDDLHGALANIALNTGSRTPQKVLYLIWRDPWMTVTPDTYIARMLELIAWHTLPRSHDDRYPMLKPGDPVWHEVDRVLLSSEPFPFKTKHLDEVRELVRPDTAVSFIDGEMTSWYGSRAIKGLRYLAQFDVR